MKRTVLITGAAGGIGRATVAAFHDAGWITLATDRRPYEDYPTGVRFFQSDVSTLKSVTELLVWVAEQTPALQALVNNAAIQISKPLVDMSVEEWDATMASNSRSVYLTTKAAYPMLQAANGAAIVNVSSVHAVATSIGIGAYATSKGAVVALSRAMAIEFAPDQIRVNSILPGAVDTDMLRDGLERGHVGGETVEERIADLGKRTVIGRVGRPEEIASAILFLADNDQSSFITGESLVVDGGATARLSTE